ncbi:MAG: M48 family metallopeptidase [bacterium]
MIRLFSGPRNAPLRATREPYTLEASGLSALVQRKPVRTLRLSVRPPDGNLRVTAPLRTEDRDILAFVLAHQNWIEKQRQRLAQAGPPCEFSYTEGEILPLWGRSVILHVCVQGAAAKATLEESGVLLLRVPEGTTQARRETAVKLWYARELLKAAGAALPALQESMGLEARTLRVRSMRSRWGSCNTRSGVITLALTLAQKPTEALEYVLVHELAHLATRSHGKRFKAILDRQLPDWRARRKRLNAGAILPALPRPT